MKRLLFFIKAAILFAFPITAQMIKSLSINKAYESLTIVLKIFSKKSFVSGFSLTKLDEKKHEMCLGIR